jgi:hypothetical protein
LQANYDTAGRGVLADSGKASEAGTLARVAQPDEPLSDVPKHSAYTINCTYASPRGVPVASDRSVIMMIFAGVCM